MKRMIYILVFLLALGLIVGCGGSSSGGSDSNGADGSLEGPGAGGGGSEDQGVDPTLPQDLIEIDQDEPFQPVPDNCLLEVVANAVTGSMMSKCLPEVASCSARFYFSGGGYVIFPITESDPDLVTYEGYDADGDLIFTMETVVDERVFYNVFYDTGGARYELHSAAGPQDFTIVCPNGAEETFTVENDSNPAVIWLATLLDEGFDCMMDLIQEEDFTNCMGR